MVPAQFVSFQSEKKDATLFQGDAFRLLESLEDESVDVTITDPPYSEVTHSAARGARPGVGLVTAKLIESFQSIDVDTFLRLCRECVRVSRRWVVLTCDWRHAAEAEKVGLPVFRLGIWVKPNGAPQFSGDRPATGWEAILILHRPGKKRWNGGGNAAVWTVNKLSKTVHPTEKPIRLISSFVRLFSDLGETILDPFMGSATTGVAALNHERKFIGCELDPEYYAVAEARIRSTLSQPMLPFTKSQ